MTDEEPGSERFLVTLTRGRWTAFILNGNCSYFPGKDKPLITAQGGAARLTARGLGSGPAQLPAFPAACASFLMRPQPYSLHAGGSEPSTGFPTVGNMVTGQESTTGERLKGKGQSQGRGGQSVGRQGAPRSLLPKLNSIYSFTVPGISLFFFMQPNCRSST